MQTTEHIDDLVEGYALNALEHDERVQVEQHIAICPPCRQLVVRLEETVHHLVFATAAAAPSVVCKRKVLERIEREQFLATPSRRRPGLPGWAMSAWASVATLALVVVSIVAMSSQRQIAATQGQLNATRSELDAMRTTLAELGAVDNLLVNGAERRLVGTDTLPQAKAVCLMEPGEEEALLLVAGLAPLPAGKAYQAWVAKGDEQAPLAVFTPEAGKPATHVKIAPPKPMDYYDAIMVTVEDAGGAQQPSEETVLLGEL